MTNRLTVTIPTPAGPAVNAALVELLGDPAAARTFTDHPAGDDGTVDASLLVCSWDLDATGHADLVDTVAATIEAHGKTGTGKTAKTADVRIGDDPRTAVKVTAATLAASKTATVDALDERSP